ncbi:MAG: glycosyltransferase family 4 protein [Planctomycetes bacterium]|nr:glycosyltransferase family 4 protein [Planctomycetota bacterium]
MSGALRVALDYRPALWSRAGIARSVRELVAALDALQPAPHDVELHLYGDCLRRAPRELGDPPSPRSEWIQLRARRVPARVAAWLHRKLGPLRRWAELDLLHTTDYVVPPLPALPHLATIYDLSFLVDRELHGAERAALLERVTRELASRAIGITTPSRTTAREIEQRLGVPAAAIHVIPLGADHVQRILQTLPPRIAAPPSRERFHLVTIGTLEPRKNHWRCLRAFERLRVEVPHARWSIVGRRGWLDEPFLAALERSSARDAIRLETRGLADRDALALLRDADLLLYAALHEGFGLPLVEAMELGVPVLSSRGGATEEVCGDAARLVDPRSEEELFLALRELARTPEARVELARRGRGRASEFRWRDAALAHLELWRASARRGGAS